VVLGLVPEHSSQRLGSGKSPDLGETEGLPEVPDPADRVVWREGGLLSCHRADPEEHLTTTTLCWDSE
jgi:hypothetical protein